MTFDPMDLLGELARRGIELRAEGDRLRFRPRSLVTSEVAERLRAHKAGLLALLASDGGSSRPPTADGAEAGDGGGPGPFARPREPSRDGPPSFQARHDQPGAGGAAPRGDGPRCRLHPEQAWWRSVFGDHVICGVCHPPAAGEVVTEWLTPPMEVCLTNWQISVRCRHGEEAGGEDEAERPDPAGGGGLRGEPLPDRP